MVSKMVLVAFMALCCSQALVSAAPKTTSDLKWDQCLNILPARVVVDAYSVVDVIKRSHHRTSDEATVACFNKYQNDPEAEAECKTAAFEALYSKMNQKAGDIKEVKTTLDKISNDCTDSSSQKAGQLADLYIPDWASCTNALTLSLIQNTRTTLDNVLKTINTVNADRQACDANATNEAALDACKIQAQKAMYLGIRYAEVKKVWKSFNQVSADCLSPLP
ncbi:putative salivary gland protein 8 [Frankliniella occidentalis]|uniref:Uncharacterized protein LOC113213576 n=1 Tax=Frankliniella occidentalis TaxID=133901 RepID=A0A6J1T581_FRAOC|nr:uncharacterized protein LOC113213576 [Frankliniella occidentalis]KAE8741800.1 putative salivary gland protein 8 [Frankliniella occidentalis]